MSNLHEGRGPQEKLEEHELRKIGDLLGWLAESEAPPSVCFPLGRVRWDREDLESAEKLIDIRQKNVKCLTSEQVQEAGFVLRPLENPQIESYGTSGYIVTMSFSELGPFLVEEDTFLDLETGRPIEYDAGIFRKKPHYFKDSQEKDS